jgi:hypothetical protein
MRTWSLISLFFFCEFQERTLATHVKTAHAKKEEDLEGGGREGRFKCEYEDCNKSFEYRHVLDRHIHRIHTNPTFQRKKRSDAMDVGLVDSLFGFTKHEARAKLPFACMIPGCEARYSRQQFLDRHLASKAHRNDVQFLEQLEDVEEATQHYEQEEIRNRIHLEL